MRQVSIFIFVLSFCVALVYLTLQSEQGEAWLSSWQKASNKIGTDSDKETEKQVIAELQMQVAALSLKIDEQNNDLLAIQMSFSQLRQQALLQRESTGTEVVNNSKGSALAKVEQETQAAANGIVIEQRREEESEKRLIGIGESQKRKREHLARLQDVVSKMEMTSLRALNN
jgi:hypothetical protein